MSGPRYRQALPQLDGRLFLTDGGIETSLIFNDGLELPDFAAFHLFRTREGEDALRRYFRGYAVLAQRHGAGLILESATWRANPDWASRLGYTAETLAAANRRAVSLLEEIRSELPAGTDVVISGCVGPRGDGYVPGQTMSAAEAADYHRAQIDTFANTTADLVTAITMNYAAEAVGVARAAQRAGMPAVISFTVETDGRLPTGQSLGEAIEQVDSDTRAAPAYFMINCAHPTHFAGVFAATAPWMQRIRGIRANASRKSHVELNESPEIDIGNPAELAAEYADLRRRLPKLNVMGGCCGTDERHIDAIAAACRQLF